MIRSTIWLACTYLLTPRGIERKAAATKQFPGRKMAEYKALEREINQLRREVRQRRRAKPESVQ